MKFDFNWANGLLETMFWYIDGTTILATLAERAKVNIDL